MINSEIRFKKKSDIWLYHNSKRWWNNINVPASAATSKADGLKGAGQLPKPSSPQPRPSPFSPAEQQQTITFSPRAS